MMSMTREVWSGPSMGSRETAAAKARIIVDQDQGNSQAFGGYGQDVDVQRQRRSGLTERLDEQEQSHRQQAGVNILEKGIAFEAMIDHSA